MLWFLLVGFAACVVPVMTDDYSVRAYQSVNGKVYSPEFDVPSIQAKNNVALSFSGGGSRSYVATLGYLAAFHRLGLMNKIRYIGGISGGSWASIVYTYSQLNVSDDVLLGDIISPADITMQKLNTMSPNCARRFTNTNIVKIGLDEWLNSNFSVYESWQYAVQEVYLSPANITKSLFTYSDASLQDIRQRNPTLRDTHFLLPRQPSSGVDSRPYPVVAATLVGPLSMSPYNPTNRNYSLLEITPLSIGVLYSRNVSYTNEQDTSTDYCTVGGMIEPFAYGAVSSKEGMSPHVVSDIIQVPIGRSSGITWNWAVGASSYGSGCLMASSHRPDAKMGTANVPYWSAASRQPETSAVMLGDGGGLQVDNIVSFLQRNVTSIILFCSTSVPLQPAEKWNVEEDELSQTQIDFDIPSLFGLIPDDIPENVLRSYDLTHSQVFPSKDFAPLVTDLQEAQTRGRGIIATTRHKTVTNTYFGIASDIDVKVTWVYLGRAAQWEDQLSDEMAALVVPRYHPEDMSSLKQEGPFAYFPNYVTRGAEMDYAQANLLASLTGWTVLQNQDIFRRAIDFSV